MECITSEDQDYKETLQSEFEEAIFNSNLELVKEIMKDPLFDPSYDDNESLKDACGLGELEIVKELLKDPRVDPFSSGAYEFAIEENEKEIVKEFLKDNMECIICKSSQTETPREKIIKAIPCTHEYHESCLLSWYKNAKNKKCCYCTQEITNFPKIRLTPEEQHEVFLEACISGDLILIMIANTDF